MHPLGDISWAPLKTQGFNYKLERIPHTTIVQQEIQNKNEIISDLTQHYAARFGEAQIFEDINESNHAEVWIVSAIRIYHRVEDTRLDQIATISMAVTPKYCTYVEK